MSEPALRLIRVTNPLQPAEGRESRELVHAPGQTLRGYLIDAALDSTELTVSLNGNVVSPETALATVPRAGDCIVVSPRVAGGGFVHTLATLAVLATSVAVGALLGPILGPIAASLIASAVLAGGNLLVSAISGLFSPAQKQTTPSYAFDGPHSLARSGSPIPKGYGKFMWGGNVIASFIDVEGKDQYLNVLVCYGFGPARAIGKIQLNNKDIGEYENVQFYTRLGTNDQTPIPSFNRIVNGYPQAIQCLAGHPVVIPGTGVLTQALQVDIQFPSGVYYHTNDGNIIEAVITYLVEYSVAGANHWQPVLQPLSTSDVVSYDGNGRPYVPHPWAAVATDQPPTSGIVYALDDGPHTPGDPWSATQTVTTYQANGNHGTYQRFFHGQWEPTDVTKNQILVNTWTDGYQDFVGADTQADYNRTSIYGLAPGKYDVRITKYGSAKIHDDVQPGDNFSPYIGQDMWVHSVNEITYQDLAYPNMILIGVRALATGQLGGSNLNILAEITHGLRSRDHNLFPAALLPYEEDNPACVAADMMLDRLYGGGQFPGITLANINRFIDEWLAWARLNDDLVDNGSGGSLRRHVFNGVFDASSDLWSSLGVVTQMSRAAILPIGRDYGVFVDGPDIPVQMFSAGNTVLDSFTETWLELDARANQVEVEFADATRNYKQDNPIAYMDPLNQNAGVAIKNVRIAAKGVTSPAQAWHLARFRERNNQFLLRSGSIGCDPDAIACRAGNVIILQNDVPQWGWGGRTLPGSSASTLLLDRNDLAFIPGTNYSVVVLFPAIQRYAGTVTGGGTVTDSTGYVIGYQFYLSNFDAANRVTRAVIAGFDCPILSTNDNGVVVKLVPGLTPTAGQVYSLFDTDVLVTAAVIALGSVPSGSGALQTALLAAPLPQPPEDFSVYFYGPTGSQKLARVANIRKSSEFRARIDWVDYDDRCYVDATPTIGETQAQINTASAVTTLTGREVISSDSSGANVSSIQLSWVPGRDTAGVVIFSGVVAAGLSAGATRLQVLDRLTGNPNGYTTPGSIGQATQYKVVGFDADGNFASYTAAPSITVSAFGVATNLLRGSSFQSGFAYWSLTPRAGDTLVASLQDDGEAVYTFNTTLVGLTADLFFQIVQPSQWAVGQPLLLSAYLTASAPASTGGIGVILRFSTPGGNIDIGALFALPGAQGSITRVNTPVVSVPAGTFQVSVRFVVLGGNVSVPAGSVFTFSHLLLETARSLTQSSPSLWADLDVFGHVSEIFTTGSSLGLRAQASIAPTVSPSFSYTFTDTTLSFGWTQLEIGWPDGGSTFIPDFSITVNGLTAATTYFAFLYYDIMRGGVFFSDIVQDSNTPSAGSPPLLFSAYSSRAEAFCNLDGHVLLTKGGLQMTTAAAGSTSPGTGSGGGSGPDPGQGPIQYKYEQ